MGAGSPQRAARPWQGQTERKPAEMLPAYDPNCYLCPSNKRAGEKQNPDYTGTFVFDNDFPALDAAGERLLHYQAAREVCCGQSLNPAFAG